MLLLSHLSLISSCVVVFVMFSVLPVLQRCGVGELGQLELVAFIAVCIVSKTKISCKNVNIIIRITMFFPYGKQVHRSRNTQDRIDCSLPCVHLVVRK